MGRGCVPRPYNFIAMIKMKEDMPLSRNGVDVTTYKKDDVLTPTSGRDKKLFEHLVQKGKAEYVAQKTQVPSGKVSAPAQETKKRRGRKKKVETEEQ